MGQPKLSSPKTRTLLPPLGNQARGRMHRDHRQLMNVSSKPKDDSFESFEGSDSLSSGDPQLQVIRGLGQGGFGVVVEVRHTVTNQTFAMKVIGKQKLRRRRDRQRLQFELKIMQKMDPSPFCLTFYRSFETKSAVFILMVNYAGGDLFFHLMQRLEKTNTAFSENEVRVLLAELAIALFHVHGQGFIHRDIKVENVMLDADGHVKLIDFGLAYELVDDVFPLSPTGSIIYMAPELINDHMGGRHTDWWAFGILMYELLTGASPWSSTHDKDTVQTEICSPSKMKYPKCISDPAMDFIDALLQKDYRNRLGTSSDADIKDAFFFSTIEWKQMAALECAPAFKPPAVSLCATESMAAEQEYLNLASHDVEQKHPLFSVGVHTASAFPCIAEKRK